MTLRVTNEQLAMLREAIDSHIYWQLSDEHYRHSGYVQPPGSDEPEYQREIRRYELLAEFLEEAERGSQGD